MPVMVSLRAKGAAPEAHSEEAWAKEVRTEAMTKRAMPMSVSPGAVSMSVPGSLAAPLTRIIHPGGRPIALRATFELKCKTFAKHILVSFLVTLLSHRLAVLYRIVRIRYIVIDTITDISYSCQAFCWDFLQGLKLVARSW